MKKVFSILFCAILFCSFMIVPTMAAADVFPDYDHLISDISDRPNYGYYIAKSTTSSDIFLMTFSTVSTANADFLLKFDTDGYVDICLEDSNGTRYNFSWTNYKIANGSWERVSGQTNVSYLDKALFNTFNFAESTHNIYRNDGTLFFQVPPTEITLAEAIQMVVEQEMPVTKVILQNQMMTIVLCGVGCLALLIGLVLLVKVLRRYLPR